MTRINTIKLPQRSLDLLEEAIKSRTYANNGPMVQEFEYRVARIASYPYAVAVCNATIGLELALRAISPTPAKCLIPAYTHKATRLAVERAKYEVVIADVDPNTFMLDPNKLDDYLSNPSIFFIPVSAYGMPIPKGFPPSRTIEDAACSLGSARSNAIAAVYSFHPRKLVTTGEGGVVVSDSIEMIQRIRAMRDFGLGNYRMSEINAAIGLGQLYYLEQEIERRAKVYEGYLTLFGNIPGVHFQAKTGKWNYQSIAIRLDTPEPSTGAATIPLLVDQLGYTSLSFNAPVAYSLELNVRLLPTGDAYAECD